MIRRDAASYRDPDGFVFEHDGALFRGLTRKGAEGLERHRRFFEAASERGLIVAFEHCATLPPGLPDDVTAAIRPDRIPLISYPYEWGFHQLKDAALHTLDVNLAALEHGLTLKDASAFNIQFQRGRTIFIDHNSFEETDGLLPWRPYSQFCRHFLNPLVVGSYRDMHAAALFRSSLDGIPQQTANDLLPLAARFSPSVMLHMILHGRFIRKSAEFERRTKTPKPPSKARQADLIRQLRAFVSGLSPAPAKSTWANYYETHSYGAGAEAEKKALLSSLAAKCGPGVVWDVGANDGTYSRLIAGHADQVVALDVDHNAVDACYLANSRAERENVLPLVYSVSDPSPSLGFRNRERTTLEQRSAPDTVLALALIHHLAITENIPLEQAAEYFAERSRMLVIEFVGADDSQVKRLLAYKNVGYDWYSHDRFLAAFSAFFTISESAHVPGTERTIYRMVKKQHG